MSGADLRRALVIGAGPAGLAAAACLRREGVALHLVDRRGVPGGAYRHIYPGITLLSPARYTSLPGCTLRVSGEYVRVPEYRDYLEQYAAGWELSPEQAEVTSIERVGTGFRVYFADRSEPALYGAVVVATGMYDFPEFPTVEGLTLGGRSGQATLHARDWPGPERFRGQRLLIVGGATGAVEIAEECARAGMRVVVSARSGVRILPQRFLGRDLHDYAYLFLEKVPLWLAGSYCNRRPTLPGTDLGFERFRREGLIRVRAAVTRFEGKRAFFAEGEPEEFEAVVLATGYQFRMPFLPDEVARAKAGHPLAHRGESRSWPGLYFVGIPCEWTLSSEFLRGIAQDASVVARSIRRRQAR